MVSTINFLWLIKIVVLNKDALPGPGDCQVENKNQIKLTWIEKKNNEKRAGITVGATER